MASQDSFSSARPPLFNGTNFAFWKIRMKIYLMSLGMEVWHNVVDGYKILTTLPNDEVGKKNYYSNARAMNVIQGGLLEREFVKVMQLESAKETWDKMVNNYEGNIEEVWHGKLHNSKHSHDYQLQTQERWRSSRNRLNYVQVHDMQFTLSHGFNAWHHASCWSGRQVSVQSQGNSCSCSQKRIFRYLQGTIDYGLWYSKNTDHILRAYTDANRVGSFDDRKSTSGGAFFLDSCLVSWLSKKKHHFRLYNWSIIYSCNILLYTTIMDKYQSWGYSSSLWSTCFYHVWQYKCY